MEAYDLDSELWDMTLCKKAGKTIREQDIPVLSTIVKDMLSRPQSDDIEKIRSESLYNFGNAGETAAAQLLKIVEDLKC
ncbi:MAG: hypothetical protein JEY91_02085 [Spirochaetaceae bacterium]|nr:hypothetical protein [Spirochaetaceae bacterium]